MQCKKSRSTKDKYLRKHSSARNQHQQKKKKRGKHLSSKAGEILFSSDEENGSLPLVKGSIPLGGKQKSS